jgi:hypothetical protein
VTTQMLNKYQYQYQEENVAHIVHSSHTKESFGESCLQLFMTPMSQFSFVLSYTDTTYLYSTYTPMVHANHFPDSWEL